MFNQMKTEGYVLGCDGCGIVIAVGENVDATWIGRKVAFAGSGWANFVCKSVDLLIEFHSDFDLRKAANAYVNPVTVTAMFDYAQKLGAKTIILMAASSALSKIMIRLT